MNAVVYVLYREELEDIKVCTMSVLVFNFPLKYYSVELNNILRTFSGSNRPKNKKAQPQLKNETFLYIKKECKRDTAGALIG